MAPVRITFEPVSGIVLAEALQATGHTGGHNKKVGNLNVPLKHDTTHTGKKQRFNYVHSHLNKSLIQSPVAELGTK